MTLTKVKVPEDWPVLLIIFLYLLIYTLFPQDMILVNSIRLILVFVLAVSCLAIKGKRYFYGFAYWNSIFLLLIVASGLWAINQKVALSGAKTVLWNTICVVLIYYYLKNRKRNLKSVLLMYSVIPVFWPLMVAVRYGIKAFADVRKYMSSVTYNRPGEVAAWGAMIAYAILRNSDQNLFWHNGTHKRKYLILFILDTVVCVMTTSRKSLVLIAVGCMAYEIFSSRNIVKLIKNIFILSIVIAILSILIIRVNYLNQLIGRKFISMLNGLLSTGGTVDSSTYARINRIKRGINWFQEKVILGYGIENYSVLSGLYRSGFDGIADNNYIEMLVDLGIVGFIIYYSFIIWIFLCDLRKRRISNDYVLSAVLIIALLVCDFGSCNYKSAIPMMIIAIADCLK